MSQEVHYTLKRGTKLTPEEAAMIEAAGNMSPEHDEDNPEIDPIQTPELYAALIQVVAERNQRIVKRRA